MALKGVQNSITSWSTRVVSELDVSWWYDHLSSKPIGAGAKWVPLIGAKRWLNNGGTEQQNILSVAAWRQGNYWLIFNEPDRADQDNISPSDAVELWREIREFIVNVDPTGKFIIGGVSNIERYGYDWMIQFINIHKQRYGMKPQSHGIHFHFYVGPEYTPESWTARLEMFHNWFYGSGFLKAEWWMTEFGSLNSDTIAQYVLEDQEQNVHLPWMTRYAWFSTNAAPYHGTLMGDTHLTALGNIYRDTWT